VADEYVAQVVLVARAAGMSAAGPSVADGHGVGLVTATRSDDGDADGDDDGAAVWEADGEDVGPAAVPRARGFSPEPATTAARVTKTASRAAGLTSHLDLLAANQIRPMGRTTQLIAAFPLGAVAHWQV
jgi:hypothetical protein